MKKRLAIFDLTDCEGCELQFLVLKEQLLSLGQDVNIVNWRLLQSPATNCQLLTTYDLAFIEGTVMTEEDIVVLQEVRKKATILVALGNCAVTGNIPTLINRSERQKITEMIYGQNYKSQAIGAWPLKQFVKVDVNLSGCPVDFVKLQDFMKTHLDEKIG